LYSVSGAAGLIVGAVIAAIGIAAAVRAEAARARKRRKTGEKEQPEQRKRKIEFSKLILALVLLPYFYGVHIGARAVLIDVSQVVVFLGFIAAPTATAIGFYAWCPEDGYKIFHGAPSFLPGFAARLGCMVSIFNDS
jgi:hypothetical protein